MWVKFAKKNLSWFDLNLYLWIKLSFKIFSYLVSKIANSWISPSHSTLPTSNAPPTSSRDFNIYKGKNGNFKFKNVTKNIMAKNTQIRHKYY